MQLFKPRIKHKFKAAFAAAFSVLTLLTTSLAASAAWEGLAGGQTGSGGYALKATPFGILSHNDVFAWRVDMYISANPDGKINKDIDTVGSNQLPLVGSLLCISENYGQESWPTYLQTNYTNQSRDTFSSTDTAHTPIDADGNIGLAEYVLPTLEKFRPGAGIYYSYDTNNKSHTVAIAKSESGGVELFKGQYGLNTDFSKIRSKLTDTDSGLYTAKLLEQMFKTDKVKYLTSILGSVSGDVRERVKSANGGQLSAEAFEKYLLPANLETQTENKSCMVEWAMVITPLYRFECNAPFYCSGSSSVTTSNKGTKYVGGGDCAALDAYWFAQSNVTTKALGKGAT